MEDRSQKPETASTPIAAPKLTPVARELQVAVSVRTGVKAGLRK
jgi:hypothetical protein